MMVVSLPMSTSVRLTSAALLVASSPPPPQAATSRAAPTTIEPVIILERIARIYRFPSLMIWSGWAPLCRNWVCTSKLKENGPQAFSKSPLDRGKEMIKPLLQCQIETCFTLDIPISSRLVTGASAIPQGTMPEKCESWSHIDGEPVVRDPAPDADADRADLRVPAAVRHPDADPSLDPIGPRYRDARARRSPSLPAHGHTGERPCPRRSRSSIASPTRCPGP